METLHSLKFTPFTAGQLQPGGWLKRQLEIQAAGLNGNMDKMWPDIRDSKWIGGSTEGWERVPYWLDGFIPLAYLLRDEDKIARAKKYIDAILERQEADGWICPCSIEERKTYDVWAVFLICKVLVVYYECSGDERVEAAVYGALKNLDRHVETDTLFNWGQCRWYECLISLYWLYERKPEEWMLRLAAKLRIEGMDYEELFRNWQFEKPDVHGNWSYTTHVVNLAMSLKSAALISRQPNSGGLDGSAFAKNALATLRKTHSTAAAHFTGDECLSGDSPVQGTECCGVVEAMYSYEQLLSICGDAFWGDMLEKLAFNTLPATLTPDMWGHQYDQQTNQVQCSYLPEGHVVFRTNSGESHLFGLEPNFGCCTANFGQGFPKFALSALMKSEKGIVVTAIAPMAVETVVNGVAVRCEVRTQYPFRDSYEVVVTAEAPVEMELALRIPGFAAGATVDGEKAQPGGYHVVARTWQGESRVQVQMVFDTGFEARSRDMACVWRGPLLYALPIEEEWVKHEFVRDGVERKAPYCDYEIFPKSAWNYAFASETFELEQSEVGDTPFSPTGAPLALKTSMTPIDWKLENGICTEVPAGRQPLGPAEEKRLIPYGCTNLRLTEAPVVK